jgi:hypothetical protein
MPPRDDLSPSGPDNTKQPPHLEKPLSEKNFIHNGWSLWSVPFWVWIALMVILSSLIFGGKQWVDSLIQQEKGRRPFLEVTNREFSVFLWQFPSFLPNHLSQRSSYLPGFFAQTENLIPAYAEELVSAPPDLIFLYHTWHRLLAPDFIRRPINPSEFEEFLTQLPEWQPDVWKQAPEGYVELIKSKNYTHLKNLQTLPESSLPLMVRQAFQGWKNYFNEGPQINDLHPTVGEVLTFLEHHPTYARSYWRNIDRIADQPIAGLNYLLLTLRPTVDKEERFPFDQLSSFLKVALFNAEQAQQNR